jgi:sterol desaturase/sphingolipid hydroxylase (fatty acid hydroxylase superfamily)
MRRSCTRIPTTRTCITGIRIDTRERVAPVPMTALYGGGAVAALFVLLFVLERRLPLRRARAPLLRRLAVNLAISALALASAFALVRPAANEAMQATGAWHFGALQWIVLPPWIALVAGVLLLDLTFYLWHVANHRLPLLWRFHVVHHIDPDLDVSTAFRFHFGEVALSAGFRVVQILLIGASPLTIVVYELMFQANTLFHHSNVRLPIGVERVLNRVLVTPRMHGIHHSNVQRENLSNFSVVFAWWDRLLRTLHLGVPQQQVLIGLPAYQGDADNDAGALLRLPFERQRDAFVGTDGSRPRREPQVLGKSRYRLAA